MKKPGQSSLPQTSPSARASATKLKLILRRLPPGLTQMEFETALGEEWKTGKGKVEWFAYQEGKISKDPSKPSRPSRAYLKIKDQSIVSQLLEKIKQTEFHDAKNTTKDTCLLGPPSLEFATFSRVPGSRLRKDGRQGTIDQDLEFIDFLQRLTEPVGRSTINGETTEGAEGKTEKVTTTPLIEFLKEKKANKAKEAAAAKAAKSQARQESKEAKAEKTKTESEAKKVTVAKKEANSTAMAEKQARIEKARQEAVKAAQKQAATIVAKNSTDTSTLTAKDPSSASPNPAPFPAKRERERGNISAAARILQRDLGLSPSARGDRRGGRGARAQPLVNASKSTASVESIDASTPSIQNSEVDAQKGAPTNTTSASTPKTTAIAPPSGPRNATPRVNSPSPPKSTPIPRPTPQPRKPPPNPQPSSGAKSAFLKHANASQGITEPLLLEAFKAYGEVLKCEIDKKKGFGYIDFSEPEGLQEAMKNSPVKVGNGQVVVLERKDKLSQKASSVKPTPAPAPIATTSTPTPTPAGPAATPAAPPTAPKASTAPTGPGRTGPPPQIRGGIPPRGGGFGPGGRGRGAFRGGGRGGFHGPPRGGGNNTSVAPTKPAAAAAAAAAAPVVEASGNASEK
ncbi:MAG: hypothetical protein Q9227_006140 [Pyrenula ochraceoflavens]